jgi:hypothetical protein
MWVLEKEEKEATKVEDVAEIHATNVRILAKFAVPLPSFLKKGKKQQSIILISKKIKQCYSQKERSTESR